MPVTVKVSVTGSYNSALESATPEPFKPPATRTLPLSSIVPVCSKRPVVMLPVNTKPAVPLPESLAVTALLLTLSTTATAPVETPVVVGANVTFIVQNAFALSEAEQLFV